MGTTLGGAYGGYGGISSYTSPYSRFGGGMYGGVGGMGGMGSYGGYGMGGMGAYGGFPGNVDPNDPNSFARGMENSTAATFQLIESIVSAFGGFAQMLESTFMATHSSFFGMFTFSVGFVCFAFTNAKKLWSGLRNNLETSKAL
jgi:peroxin-13